MSTASFDNIQPSAGGTARNAPRGIAAAWADLNGTGTIALRDSENVSSVVDNGTGDYTFNFTTAMANTNFSVGASAGSVGVFASVAALRTAGRTVSNSRVTTNFASGGTTSFVDLEFANANYLGDLA